MSTEQFAGQPADTFTCQHVVCILGEEGPISLPFSAVQAYHGHGALAMLAITYQGMQGAMQRLQACNDGQLLARKDLVVTSGHPGPGVRDAFEFITRAATRGCYRIDTSLPWARYSQDGARSYSFVLEWRGHEVRGVLREGALPARFFSLLASKQPGAAEDFQRLRRQLAHEVLAQSPEVLFEYLLTPPVDQGLAVHNG